MDFEWDAKKALSNLKAHRVSFKEAATVFGDPPAITFPDPDQSATERRFITIGFASSGKLLTVAHTERGDNIRLISARKTTRAERKLYDES